MVEGLSSKNLVLVRPEAAHYLTKLGAVSSWFTFFLLTSRHRRRFVLIGQTRCHGNSATKSKAIKQGRCCVVDASLLSTFTLLRSEALPPFTYENKNHSHSACSSFPDVLRLSSPQTCDGGRRYAVMRRQTWPTCSRC